MSKLDAIFGSFYDDKEMLDATDEMRAKYREEFKTQIKDLMIKVYDEDYYTFKKNLEAL